MKKITLLILFCIPIISFSQSNNEKIQNYLNANYSKLGLTNDDIHDWFIESDGNSESTKIDNYYIKQRFQNIEIYNALSNVWSKEGVIINVLNGFIPNVNQKINTTTPALNVLQALDKAFVLVDVQSSSNQIIETISPREFKISNGILTQDPITAELVYQPVGDALLLAWDFTFYTPDYTHLWSMRIDAVNGKLLAKNDMVISCNFDNHAHDAVQYDNTFTRTFLKEQALMPAQVMGGSYRVIPFNYESPNHGARQLIANPENVLASPKGWHDTNTIAGTTPTLKYTYTRGNNTWARSDYTGTNPTLPTTTSTANGYAPTNAGLVFDYPYPGTSASANTYIDAACTNLFYMNNVMHDIWYQYGFNEANGNFQKTNYTTVTAPAANDFVYADAQDGSTAATPTSNNANFSTPVDGTNGRMQMYLWSYRKITQLLNVNSPADIAGLKYASDNAFNPGHVNVPVSPAMIQTDLVLYDDGSQDIGQTDNADACSPAVNAAALNGHIAVVRRSTSAVNGGTPCAFAIKVKYAQDAGAVAVIVVNNDDTAPNASISMSGADASITIPAIAVSLTTGEAIIAKIKGQLVNAKIQSDTALDLFVNTDGDFDNGVIAHEYGHGISTRLAGGRNNSSCLQNPEQMGEGWSDWFAMMLQLKPGDVGTTPKGMGTFVVNQNTTGSGLRNYPYTTDMTVNPITFGATNGTLFDIIVPDANGTNYVESHNVGEIWTTMLWDLTWAYIAKYGYDDNKYTGTGGNNKVMRLVLDAIKLQPCGPSFIQARNAIIAADQATTGGADYCMIWQVFARRGMGVNASSGSNSGDRYNTAAISDQVEDFTTPPAGPNCTLGINYFENTDMIKVYPNPSKGLVNIHINQFSGKINIQVVDINGRIVYDVKNDSFNIEKTINLSHLQTGMYVIKINGEELNHTQKIIIN